MLNYRLFLLERCCKIDELSYYAYRRMKIFGDAKYLWRIVDSGSGNSDWVQSLYTRLELYLRAVDKLKTNALRKPTNLVGAQLQYDFAFLVFVITGMFDNLAWLICKIYNINVDKMSIKLTISPKKRERKFLDAVKEKDLRLYSFLTCERIQAKISLLYPIRDSIVHREYFSYVRYIDVQEKIEDIYLKVNTDMLEKLLKLVEFDAEVEKCFEFNKIGESIRTNKTTGKTEVFREYEDMFIIPHSFIDVVDFAVIDVVNGILSIITASVDRDAESDKSSFFDNIEPLYF